MGKTRAKSRKEIEHLRGIIRNLKKQLKHQQHGEIDEETEESGNCPKCGKGLLLEIDLGRIKFLKCNICEHREKTNGEEIP
jgi:ssDNA-binding Zn-finger/Zn-ribbon topoisomerase 1